jgi:hypothetical protein
MRSGTAALTASCDAAVNVLCAYTKLTPAAADALTARAPGAARISVEGNLHGYWQAIAARWAGTGDLVLIEHDIVIHSAVLPGFAACPQPWCLYPYDLWPGQVLERGLGCTRFTARCQSLVTPEQIQAESGGTCIDCRGERGCWRHLDGQIAAALETRGLTAHVHQPPVFHDKER